MANAGLALGIAGVVAALAYGVGVGGAKERARRSWYDYRGSVRTFRRRRRIAGRRIGDFVKVVIVPIAIVVFVGVVWITKG